MVDLFKRMFGKNAPSEPGAVSAARADEALLAARRAQISNDLVELQQIAMAELALRKEQYAAAGKTGFEVEEENRGGRVLIL